jgi:hypothetical protein
MRPWPEPPDPVADPTPDPRDCPFAFSHNCHAHLESWPAVLAHLQAAHPGQWPGQAPRTEPFVNERRWPDAAVSYELDELTDGVWADLERDAAAAQRQGLC